MVSKFQWKPFWLATQQDPHYAHLQVVIQDNDRSLSRITTCILERMQDGIHSSTTGASARSWWTPTPASWYSFSRPPECNGGPARGISCWKILGLYSQRCTCYTCGSIPAQPCLVVKVARTRTCPLSTALLTFFFRFQVHVCEQPLHLVAGECAVCQIMYSLAGLFWRNNLGFASVISSEQTARSYLILYRMTGLVAKPYEL